MKDGLALSQYKCLSALIMYHHYFWSNDPWPFPSALDGPDMQMRAMHLSSEKCMCLQTQKDLYTFF